MSQSRTALIGLGGLIGGSRDAWRFATICATCTVCQKMNSWVGAAVHPQCKFCACRDVCTARSFATVLIELGLSIPALLPDRARDLAFEHQ